MDMSRVSVWSGALIDLSLEEAMKVISAIGYQKIDPLERLPHFSLFADECDPAAVKAAAEAHGLQISNLATYPGGGLDGRTKAWAFSSNSPLDRCCLHFREPIRKRSKFGICYTTAPGYRIIDLIIAPCQNCPWLSDCRLDRKCSSGRCRPTRWGPGLCIPTSVS